MANRKPFSYPRFQAFDANGDPLSGGTAEFFDAGTTTNRTVYSDPEVSTALPNPVTLNSRGEPESGGGTPVDIYFDGNAYKIVLKDSAGATVWTIDDFIQDDLSDIAEPKDPPNATDASTDVFEAVLNRDPNSGEEFVIDFQSTNTTTTPTFENTTGSLGALTIKTRNGSALWSGALEGIHTLKYDGTDYLLRDPALNSGAEYAASMDQGVATTDSPTFDTLTFNGRDPEHATDSGTDAFVSATNTTPPADGVQIVRDFQSSNTTTTPTLDGKTITDRDGNALWASAISGPHTLQRDQTADTYLLLYPRGEYGVYPEYFGAVGDGVTDDSSAIQSALDTGRRVYMRGVTYAVQSAINMQTQEQRLIGTAGTTLKAVSGFPTTGGDSAQSIVVFSEQKITVDRVTLDCNSIANNGVFAEGGNVVSRLNLSDMYITNAQQDGVRLSDTVWMSEMTRVRVDLPTAYGFNLMGSSGLTTITMRNCYVASPGTGGFRLALVSGFFLEGCACDGANGYAVFVDGNSEGSIAGFDSENTTQLFKVFGGASAVHVTGSRFLAYGDDTTPPSEIFNIFGTITIQNCRFLNGESATLFAKVNGGTIRSVDNNIQLEDQSNSLSNGGLIKGDQQFAHAWVNFDGTSTVSIRDHYNISSITDNGTGDYTINFSSNLADANYAPVAMTNKHSTVARGAMAITFDTDQNGSGTSPAVGSLRINTVALSSSTSDAGPTDADRCCVAILGGN